MLYSISINSKVFSFQIKIVYTNTKELLVSYRYILDNVILFRPISGLISMPRI